MRRLRVALYAALIIDVAVLGTDLYLLDGVSNTTEVDFDEALDDFRAGTTTTTVPTTQAPATSSGTPTSGPAAEVAPAAVSDVPPVVATPDEPTATTAPTVAPFQRPAAGVYRYRTTGGETISVLGARHQYPAETYAVVSHEGGCRWRVRSDVVAEHRDERLMCSEPGRILQLEQTRLVTFFGTTDGGAFTCDPPQVQHAVGDGQGATAVSECSGSGSTARLTRRTLGTGTVTVGGTVVDVIRLRIDGEVRGRVSGTSTDIVTLHAGTGLPIVWERSADNLANAFGASIRYKENARFELVSLTPAT